MQGFAVGPILPLRTSETLGKNLFFSKPQARLKSSGNSRTYRPGLV